MSDQLYYLFIGGAADGKRLALPAPVDHHRYPVPKSNQNDYATYYADYRSQKFTGGGAVIIVYVYEDLTPDLALKQLVERYPESTC